MDGNVHFLHIALIRSTLLFRKIPPHAMLCEAKTGEDMLAVTQKLRQKMVVVHALADGVSRENCIANGRLHSE